LVRWLEKEGIRNLEGFLNAVRDSSGAVRDSSNSNGILRNYSRREESLKLMRNSSELPRNEEFLTTSGFRF